MEAALRYALLLLLLTGCEAYRHHPDPYGLGAAGRDLTNSSEAFRGRRTYIPVQPMPGLNSQMTRCSTFGGSTVCNTN